MIWALIVVFCIGLIAALSKQRKCNIPTREYSDKSTIRKTPQVQPYSKYQKKVNRRKGKAAMFRANNLFLSIDEANSLLSHDGTSDEMMLLDLILDAKLNGQKNIIIDRLLYDRLKNKISL